MFKNAAHELELVFRFSFVIHMPIFGNCVGISESLSAQYNVDLQQLVWKNPQTEDVKVCLFSSPVLPNKTKQNRSSSGNSLHDVSITVKTVF